MKNILIIGGGGREHALAWKIKQSANCGALYVAPGNAGTAQIAENVSIDLKNNQSVVDFAKQKDIGLVVVAPDDYLAQGMVNALTEAGIKAFGPTREAAKLEWSKAFSKQFMKDHNIPTAEYFVSTSFENALHRSTEAIEKYGRVVIKADGLALGKGVDIVASVSGAESTLKVFMEAKKFGESGTTVVTEEFLEGSEVSIHAFCDGEHAVMFPVSRDHKRIGEGNTGQNTGGMGTIAPVLVPDGFLDDVKKKVVMPVLKGMKEMGTPFKGVLYPGLMLTKDGYKVLEFNARFGDPETQSYMLLLDSDIIDIMEATIDGSLDDSMVRWSDSNAITVVMASRGYPEKSEIGIPIRGLDTVHEPVIIFHAGTKKENAEVVTSGGRVLGVSAVGKTLDEARETVYTQIKGISFEGSQYRKDIGK